MATTPEDLLLDIVSQMVDRPEKVRISTEVYDDEVVHNIEVAYSDVGKVLGKRGRYAHALRDIFSAIYGKQKKRLVLDVVDPRDRR